MPNASPFSFAPPEWLDEVDSTSDEIRRRLALNPGLPPGTAIATHLQTRGKGRLGRSWHSAVDAGLTFSFLWSGGVPLNQAATLPMACALAAKDFLLLHGVHCLCKWPNDILVDDAKICGILAESLPSDSGGLRIIMGMGINLADDPERDRLVEQPTASLTRATGKKYDPVELLPMLLDALTLRIRAWSRFGFAGIRDDLRACLWGIGREAGVRTGKNGGTIVRGRINALGEGGELLLIDDEGRTFSVVSVSALDI